jgi:hypothetical protein
VTVIIAAGGIDIKDTSCLEVCPADCILAKTVIW